jgi:transcriptional regulator GlxA family with amidase domain
LAKADSHLRRTRGDRPIDVVVVLLDRAYVSTAIGPIEVFHSAGLLWQSLRGEPTQPRFRVHTATVDRRPVSSVGGLTLKGNGSIRDFDDADLILIGAIDPEGLDAVQRRRGLLDWIRRAHERGSHVGAICSGVACLAASGLLDGRRATTHWALGDTFRERWPDVAWQTEQMVTEDGRLYCSGGVYASLDLSLYLVDKFCGREVALQCAHAMVLSMPRTSQGGYAMVPMSRPHADDRIRGVEDYLQRHFAGPVSIESLAQRVGMSPRNLARRFKAATGHMPGAYLQDLRVAAAKELLERGSHTVQTVSMRVGYDDVAFFRSLFKRRTGMTPVEYRSRFAPFALERS